MPKIFEMLNFKQLRKHILRVFPSFWGKFNSVGLDHSGSQPFKYSCNISDLNDNLSRSITLDIKGNCS